MFIFKSNHSIRSQRNGNRPVIVFSGGTSEEEKESLKVLQSTVAAGPRDATEFSPSPTRYFLFPLVLFVLSRTRKWKIEKSKFGNSLFSVFSFFLFSFFRFSFFIYYRPPLLPLHPTAPVILIIVTFLSSLSLQIFSFPPILQSLLRIEHPPLWRGNRISR